MAESSGGQDPTSFLFKMGLEYFEQAKIQETKGKVEESYKLYREAAHKFIYIIKNNTTADANIMREVKELAQKAIDSGLWMKTQMDDQRDKARGKTLIKSKPEMTLGLRLCGQNYMEAFKFYWDLGEFYFSLVAKNKGILPAAKACYIIAAENLNAVRSIVSDKV